jgi:hypothetical protein
MAVSITVAPSSASTVRSVPSWSINVIFGMRAPIGQAPGPASTPQPKAGYFSPATAFS